ncbi:MAG: hypothetical protein HZA13_08310 [Nitrospirae bacterium]|nr:hypothetical protein [Nitrospirota bacterium]
MKIRKSRLQRNTETRGFGCGSIGIDGHGTSGPSDPGGPASLLAISSLPFIFRWWRNGVRGFRGYRV